MDDDAHAGVAPGIRAADEGNGDAVVGKHLPVVFAALLSVDGIDLVEPPSELGEVVPFGEPWDRRVRVRAPYLLCAQSVRDAVEDGLGLAYCRCTRRIRGADPPSGLNHLDKTDQVDRPVDMISVGLWVGGRLVGCSVPTRTSLWIFRNVPFQWTKTRCSRAYPMPALQSGKCCAVASLRLASARDVAVLASVMPIWKWSRLG